VCTCALHNRSGRCTQLMPKWEPRRRNEQTRAAGHRAQLGVGYLCAKAQGNSGPGKTQWARATRKFRSTLLAQTPRCSSKCYVSATIRCKRKLGREIKDRGSRKTEQKMNLGWWPLGRERSKKGEKKIIKILGAMCSNPVVT
jgi:hypothetical protein